MLKLPSFYRIWKKMSKSDSTMEYFFFLFIFLVAGFPKLYLASKILSRKHLRNIFNINIAIILAITGKGPFIKKTGQHQKRFFVLFLSTNFVTENRSWLKYTKKNYHPKNHWNYIMWIIWSVSTSLTQPNIWLWNLRM